MNASVTYLVIGLFILMQHNYNKKQQLSLSLSVVCWVVKLIKQHNLAPQSSLLLFHFSFGSLCCIMNAMYMKELHILQSLYSDSVIIDNLMTFVCTQWTGSYSLKLSYFPVIHLIHILLSLFILSSLFRSENIRESQIMSMQRNVSLHELDVNGPGLSAPKGGLTGNKKKDPPPIPPTKKTLPPVRAHECGYV